MTTSNNNGQDAAAITDALDIPVITRRAVHRRIRNIVRSYDSFEISLVAFNIHQTPC
jgi:hypothetical protein